MTTKKKPESFEEKVSERVEQILNEDPKTRHERTMRVLAERIAYYEVKAEEERQRGPH
jgi:hypothetical protein